MFFVGANTLGARHDLFSVGQSEFLNVGSLGFLTDRIVVATQKFASHDGVVGLFAVIEFAFTGHTEKFITPRWQELPNMI